MDVKFAKAGDPAKVKGNLAVLAFEGEDLEGAAAESDDATGGAIKRLLEEGEFQLHSGKSTALGFPAGLATRQLTVAGCGRRDKFDAEAARKAGGAAAARFGRRGGTVFAPVDDPPLVAEIALGAGLRSYRYERLQTEIGRDPDEPKRPKPGPVTIAVADTRAANAAFAPRAAAMAGVGLTRDLVNEPANLLGPVEFAARLKEMTKLGVQVTVLDVAKLEKIGMRTLLAVGQGSARPSRVVAMRWPGKGGRPLALVGKGVVFDTGGISIKPAKGMEEMVMDMGGAGVVAGVIKSLALRKAPQCVVGVVGLVENMPDGKAQRPGDVVESLSGRTVEVINTDAEGRLVLADLLTWVQSKYKPAWIVDLATLTGAMVVALGTVNAGYFSNDDGLSKAMEEAALAEGEGLWRMPLGKEYAKTLKSRVADLKNVSDGPWGGAITAAEFLHAFIDKDVAWAHIDIAGVALSSKHLPLSPEGATGWGVRTLDRLVASYQGGKGKAK